MRRFSCFSISPAFFAFALPVFSLVLLVGMTGQTPAAAAPARTLLFCFWNLENFFDDRVDGWDKEPDKTFDQWFADDKKIHQLKLDNIAKALLAVNDGKGPDILCVAEAENERALDLLRLRLNKGLRDPALHYKHVLCKDPMGGRAIMTGIITRVDVDESQTRLLGSRQRILEGHLTINGNKLIVIASHWTARVTDTDGGARGRYADQIYNRYKVLYRTNPKVNFIVCGDFNDDPDDDSIVKHLHAVGDKKKVLESREPMLFNLFADRIDGKEGSHHYRDKWMMFDQICVSPALLTEDGLTVEPKTAEIIKEHTTWTFGRAKGQPMPFGNKNNRAERGTSDHLPVTVRIKAAASK